MFKLTQQVYIRFLNSVTIFSYSETNIQITFSPHDLDLKSQFRNHLQLLWNKHSDHIQSTRLWAVVQTCQKRWPAALSEQSEYAGVQASAVESSSMVPARGKNTRKEGSDDVRIAMVEEASSGNLLHPSCAPCRRNSFHLRAASATEPPPPPAGDLWGNNKDGEKKNMPSDIELGCYGAAAILLSCFPCMVDGEPLPLAIFLLFPGMEFSRWRLPYTHSRPCYT
jgi:hypothetical protein